MIWECTPIIIIHLFLLYQTRPVNGHYAPACLQKTKSIKYKSVLSLKRDGWRLSRKIWSVLFHYFPGDTQAETKPTGSASCNNTGAFLAPQEHKVFLPATWHPQVLLPPFCMDFQCIPPALAAPPPIWPCWQLENSTWESVGYC